MRFSPVAGSLGLGDNSGDVNGDLLRHKSFASPTVPGDPLKLTSDRVYRILIFLDPEYCLEHP
jgi:hypothetical protein